MWQVWMSDFPGTVFVIVEDTGRSSRAKVWRDWELATKKWKKQKRQEIEARRKRDAQKPSEQHLSSGRTDDGSANTEGTKPEGNPTSTTQADTAAKDENQSEPMDVDAAASITDADAAGAKVEADVSGPSVAPTSEQATIATSLSTEQSTDTTMVDSIDDDPIETAGPKPALRLPSHTRYTVSALTSSMSAMLTSLNLPPPHGAPVGTAGPGAWVPRGAAVSIEGLILEINSSSLNALPGISPALTSVSTADDAVSSSGVDWRVRVGSVMGGGGRSAGAIVEAEFLPISTLLPTSKFMHDFLYSLFPPGLVPMPAPVAGMNAQGAAATSLNGSVTGTPRMGNATLGAANNTAASTTANASSASYTIGGGTTGATPPNRNFNIPVVSDQLWEEVVPRSGEGWRRRIAKRSHQMKVAARVQRRQRKNATTSTQSVNKTRVVAPETNGDDAFGWHTFGSDEEPDAEAHANGDWQDDNDLSSSESETDQVLVTDSIAAAGGLTGTAVTMQQVDEEDDDDDDDRPLGAPAWSNANTRTSSASNLNSASVSVAAAAKKEDTVQLIFQGLRADEKDADDGAGADGWSGIERGRRIAFQYVQMLRAEGII
uniref:Uncharacterized protein n=2 Tax=Kalmanozyma brasiliensis (strain GHG001) TaxID=1365824 RepID=V5EY11_KALBG